MKLAVFDEWRVGLVQGDQLRDVTRVVPDALSSWPKMRMNWLIEHWATARAMVEDEARTTSPMALSRVRLRAANPAPAHVFAAPANYRKHIGELGDRAVTKGGRTAREQGFFLKAPGSLAGPAEGVRLPRGSTRRFDHESELAVVIGRGGRNIPREKAMEYVFGYSCLVDLTMRIEPGVGEEERSMRKSFESFTPLGPWITTADEIANPGALTNQLWVNGKLRQDANTSDLIVGVAELIEMVSSVLPLTPGDVIASGTPEGVGPVVGGDELRIAIQGVGDMTLKIMEHEQRSPRAY